MDLRTKILLIGICFLFVGAVFLSYDKYIVQEDYYMQSEVDCDPGLQSCFVQICDPTEDETCPEEEAERVEYYKLVSKKAYLIPTCGETDEDCNPFACQANEDCFETLCSPGGGDTCSEGSL